MTCDPRFLQRVGRCLCSTSSWTSWETRSSMAQTHMMMLGTNNSEVADVILNWAGENITSKAKSSKCRIQEQRSSTGRM
jgi:NAD dependent epimerase/dehydratase family enzyme